MATAKHCIECGALLPGTSAGALCPACALRGALAPGDGEEPEDQRQKAASGNREEEIGNQKSPLRAPSHFGDYELLEQIGRDGMGLVYRARQKSLDRIVALKLLLFGPQASPEFARRFRAEAVLAAGLQHPNIVAIHEVGVQEEQPFYVMDYVAGPSLAQLVGQQPLPARRAARYQKTIAEAIHYAHERGILHRDLKPSNVLIDTNDKPRVTDFGMAKQLAMGVEVFQL